MQAGVLGELPLLLRSTAPASHYVIITDEPVSQRYGVALADRLEAAGQPVTLLSVPSGEAQKTRARWTELTDRMIDRGVARDAAVVALGGGVIGDLAGFVAATYMRGLPVVQVPTTLLAMVDASVGGKCAVDTPGGKNLVGVIRQPRLVACDPLVLGSLPPEAYRAGLAEAVKHGAIADRDYFESIRDHADALLGRDPTALAELIAGSVQIKAGVVSADPEETGARQALNFGHTVAHALETLSGYRLAHGDAVAIGMGIEAELGEAAGLTEPGTAATLRAVLASLGLPSHPPEAYPGDVVARQMLRDKKVRAGRTRFVLLRRLGELARDASGAWSIEIDPALTLDVLGR